MPITAKEFGEAVAEIIRDYMPGDYVERSLGYTVVREEGDIERGTVFTIRMDTDNFDVVQHFRVTFEVEEIK